MKRFCSVEDREVPYERHREGLRALEGAVRRRSRRRSSRRSIRKATRTVEIHDFVDLAEIDPIYYDDDLLPRARATAAKAVPAPRSTRCARPGKVAIATLRAAHARVALLRAADRGRARALHDEPRRRGRPGLLARAPEAREARRSASCRWPSSSSGRSPPPFEPERYPDLHRERCSSSSQKKAEGETIEAPEPEQRARRGGEPRRRALREPRRRATTRGEGPRPSGPARAARAASGATARRGGGAHRRQERKAARKKRA